MNMLFRLAVVTAVVGFSQVAKAGDEYNTVPAGNHQYSQCLRYSAKNYEGGNAASPIRGQTKAQAWCTCMWNETPDNFRGNLAKFSETARGKKTNKICERYADWG